MDTVSVQQTFTLPSTENETGASTENENEVKDESGLVIETNDITGHHTANAFQNRIWINFDTVKLTSYLFNFIFGDHIKTSMYLEKNTDDRVM